MALIRPELAAALGRWSEVIWACAMLGAGLWIASLGGLILIPAGLALAALGLGWAVTALRRMRFHSQGAAPGVVEVDEAQIGYLGPGAGGFVSLDDLVEVRLLTLGGQRLWRLKQADGQALLIPVDAAGAERLYDAFATLPGFAMATAVGALEAGAAATAGPAGGTALTLAQESRLVWSRPARGVSPDLQPPGTGPQPPRNWS